MLSNPILQFNNPCDTFKIARSTLTCYNTPFSISLTGYIV